MDALGKRKNTQQVLINNTNYIESKIHMNNDSRRFKKKLRHKQGSSSAHEDKQSKKVDWQSVSPFFKRIIPKPPIETWGSGLRVLDQAMDPLWINSDKECVSKSEYLQILQYLQNKCNIYDLELSRPDEKHDNFINKIAEEIISVCIRPNSEDNSQNSAIKILINFGNSAAWAIFDRGGNHQNIHDAMALDGYTHPSKIHISSYVALSSSEYEYLLNLFQYVAITGDAEFKNHIPIIGKFIRSESECEAEVEEDLINLGGFVWKVNPSNSSSVILEEMIDKYSLRGLLQANDKMPDLGESDSFTGQQLISTLYELMVIETELQDMRAKILSQMCLENIYPYKLVHEPRVGQLIMNKAKASQRWSQFRRIISSAINHYSKQMINEKGNSNEPNSSETETKSILTEEYCSVCLMAEQAHKHILIQCKRCRIRIHYQCYVNISNGPISDANSWLCDVCVEEGGRGDTHVANKGICVICGSSGGAMKSVEGDVAMYFTQLYTAQCTRIYGDFKPPLTSWIHIICGAWLIPSVNCKDWTALSNWDITNLRSSSKSNRCAICMAALGFYITCKTSQCGVKMHPLCAWLGGMYASVKFIYSKSLSFNNATDSCFTPFQIEVFCPFHSCKEFSQGIVKRQARERTRAYLHYVMNPNPFNKQRQPNKPMVLSPSPVVITLNGPVALPGLVSQEAMSYQMQNALHNPMIPLRPPIPHRGRLMFMSPKIDHSMSYREFVASQQASLQPRLPGLSMNMGMRYVIPSNATSQSKGRTALLHLDSIRIGICSVCYEDSTDPTFQCKRCGIYLHHRCYFTRDISSNNLDLDAFICVSCRVGVDESECSICRCKGGALLLAMPGDRIVGPPLLFAHPCCAVFSGLAVSTDAYTGLHHFCGLGNLTIDDSGICSICDGTGGISFKCNQQNCERRIHISCAKRSGCYIEIKHAGRYVFCIQHTQTRESISPRLRMYLKLLAFVEIANIALDFQSQ